MRFIRRFRRARGASWMVWLAGIALGSSLLTATLSVATRLDPIPQGLQAEYFSNTNWTPPSAAATLDPQPSTNHLVDAWLGSPPETFSVSWMGWVSILREGTYAFGTISDGRASLFIDGQPVGGDGSEPGTPPMVGLMRLGAGSHEVVIRYVHERGPVRFDFLWAHDGLPLTAIPPSLLRPRRVRSLVRLRAESLLDRSVVWSEWLWVGMLLLCGAGAVRRGILRLRTFLEHACDWRSLRWILGGSVVLNLSGIWWGLPGSWVAIELKATYVLDALSQHFSHGWFDAYPPFHFQLLAAAMSPMLLLRHLDLINFDGAGYTLLVVISRLVSVVAGIGIVIATCLCGTQAFGRRAGWIAAAIMSVTAPFLYYAKTANVDVPYLWWCALSLVFYLRLLDRAHLRDYVCFAAAATLAVCTKDQAYGFYWLAPFVIVDQMWRVNRQAAVPHPLRRAVFDRRLAAAAATSALLFVVCHNVVFNSRGFIDHVRFITGPGSANYRLFEPTLGGHAALLRLTVHLIAVSLGGPLFLTCLIGLLVAAATPRLRRVAVWLIVPAVSYYLGFIDVILYNYDRFVLPMCLVLALFGGLALDVFASSSRRARAWWVTGITAVFAYTVLYASTVDVLMIADSRHAVEQWMHAHVGHDDLVGTSGLNEYLPRLDDFHVEDISTIAQLELERPSYVVLNADYARAVPPETGWGQLIAALHHDALGYRLVGRFRHRSPWPWLPWGHPDLIGPRQETVVVSTLRNINPTIEVFQRDDVTTRLEK